VRERLHVGLRAQRANLVDVELVRCEQQVGVEVVVADERAHERVPVRVQPARREPDDRVTGRATRAVDHAVAVDDADAGAGEVELAVAVDARQLCRLAADEHASCRATDLRRALDELGDLLQLDPFRGDVIEQEQRLGAAAENVVDAVRREIHPRPAQLSRTPREHQLRADTVRRRREEPRLVERKEPGEVPEPRRAGRLDSRAQPPDDGVRGRQRDPGGLVGACVLRQEGESTGDDGRPPAGVAGEPSKLRRMSVSSGGVHHVDLVVSSIERSLPFYRELLGPLGWTGLREIEGERGETIWHLNGRGCSIGLREAQSPSPPHDRYAVGLHHLALEAGSRAAVDESADWLSEHGAVIESGPEEYSYLPGYYAVFFYDPDGLKLEILHVGAFAA
jgi:glyoxylase I family protein